LLGLLNLEQVRNRRTCPRAAAASLNVITT
jgi:hypothetical protein